MIRRVGLLLASALAFGCAAPGDDPTEDVGSEDAALAALEQRIGFDGAVEALDEAALARVDASARRLETTGSEGATLEAHATRAVLVEARARGAGDASRVAPRSYGGLYDTDLLRLNGLERALCKGARLACVRVLLAGVAARTASQLAYDDGNVGGRIDAFRHTSWNALMVRWTDARTAKAWADAHENGYPENRTTRRNRVLSDMDFWNNDVGRRLGAALPAPAGLPDVTAAVRKSLELGELRAVRYDRGDADGVLVPTRQCSEAVRCGT